MADKSIIIIGAGISGLSAGCYAQMNGYRTRIFEMHNKPGGLCTAWERKGYNIGTPGYLMGSGPANNDYYRFWEELGALQGRTFINYEELARIEGRDGQVFVFYTDINRLEQHMKELAPEDEEAIAEFILVLRTLTQFKMSRDLAPELSGPPPEFEMPPYMVKYLGMCHREFGDQFKNSFLQEALGEALTEVFFSAPDASLFVVLTAVALMHQKAAGYPVGGFLELARAIERRYYDLGGEIHYDARVEKILVEDDKAVGVQVEDGSEYRSDIVISAADGHTTIFEMLEGKYINDQIRGYYDKLDLYPPLIHVSLGVNRSFEERPPALVGDVFPLDEPITIAGRDLRWLVPDIPSFDPSLAPEGKTLVKVRLATDYDYWRDLKENNPKGYKTEQVQIADEVIARLDRRYPGLAAQVDMVDVATPVSFERYTGCWQGGWLGWVGTPQTMGMHMSKSLPGLDGFYMVGTWVFNGSLPMAATSGRHVTQIICHKDERSFVTTIP